MKLNLFLFLVAAMVEVNDAYFYCRRIGYQMGSLYHQVYKELADCLNGGSYTPTIDLDYLSQYLTQGKGVFFLYYCNGYSYYGVSASTLWWYVYLGGLKLSNCRQSTTTTTTTTAAPCPTQDSECPEGYSLLSGTDDCYKFVEDTLTRDGVIDACLTDENDLGNSGLMVNVTSQDVQDKLEAIRCGSTANAWIALDRMDGRDFRWQTDEIFPLTYTNWGQGQPPSIADLDATGVKCGYMQADGLWLPTLCSETQNAYFCQIGSNS